jgi:hypothetical protein
MDIGDTLHVADLKLPDGVESVGDTEQGVASCHMPKVVVEEAPAEIEAAAAPAAAAAATPATTPAPKAEGKK